MDEEGNVRVRLILVVTAAALGVMVWAAPVNAGGSNGITVVAVVNGTPTGPLELTRTCADNPPGNATSASFTSSVDPAIPLALFGSAPPSSTCTVAVTQAGGMIASFACIVNGDQVGMSCGAGNDSVTSLQNRSSRAVITVTFDPVPSQEAPAAVAAPPAFTG